MSACAISGILNHFLPAAASSNDIDDQMLFHKIIFLVIGTVGLIISAAIREKEDALQIRQEFLSTASHELRTPLTSLFLQAQSRVRRLNKGSSEEFFSGEKMKEMFSSDVRQLRQLSKLVDDMLDISRLSTGKFSIEREPGSLSLLVSDLLLRLKPQLEAMGSQLNIFYDDSEPLLGEWDALRLEQAVTNLVINAGKYGLKRPVTVRLNRVGKKAQISIEDQGRGISPEDQARIFKPFERAVSISEVSGLGLGLYISSQIIQAHGGRISLKSEVGQGSTFTMELPLMIVEDEIKSASSSRHSVLSRG
jgi:signal transduction histidine kinase